VDTAYWPFLIAASDLAEYRVVLCPDFIASARRVNTLRNSVDVCAEDYLEGRLQFAAVKDEKVGPLSIFYKNTRFQKDRTDASGRPLVDVAGIVIRGVIDRKQLRSAEAERLLENSQPEITAALMTFWSSGASAQATTSASRPVSWEAPRSPPDNRKYAVSESDSVTVHQAQSGGPSKSDYQSSLDLRSRISRRVFVMLLVLLAASTLTNAVLYRRYAPLSDQIRELQNDYAKLERSVKIGTALVDARLKRLEADTANRAQDDAQRLLDK
jgi:hypothetical protein